MPSERERVIVLLDTLQAAERAGAEALRAWSATCHDPALRGGLRALASRDAGHAQLAEARMRALGCVPTAGVSPSLAALCSVLSAPDPPDVAKLATLLARFPLDPMNALAAVVDGVEQDRETRGLLETIAEDERVSLTWLRSMQARDGTLEHVVTADDSERIRRCLDGLRAAEAASAEVFVAWAAECARPHLRGALRAIAAREAGDAALLAERLGALGARPVAQVAESMLQAALEHFGGREVSDAEKVEAFLSHGAEVAAEAATALASATGTDLETREVLRLIAACNRATMAWMQAARAG